MESGAELLFADRLGSPVFVKQNRTVLFSILQQKNNRILRR